MKIRCVQAEEKTVIMISHRSSACRNADQVYVIDGGRIAERGTHYKLLDKGGIYSDMWHLQASGYAEQR